MSVRKLAVAVAVAAFMASGSVFAQAQAPAAAPTQQAAEEADEEEAVEEAVAPPPPPAPLLATAPVVELPAPAPAAEAKPAAKPETKVEFYGSASYRFRGRLWSANAEGFEVKKDSIKTTEKGNDYGRDKKDPVLEFKNNKVVKVQTKDTIDRDGSSFDYLNLLGWSFGAKVKVDDQLSLQFQIGNDLTSGETVTWASNNSPGAATTRSNALYVHLAYAAYNPGPFTLTGGVIPVTSNGTLDLLERSLSTGSYGDAIFQTWSTQLNNSLIGLKLGLPIVKEGVKVSAEVTTSVIESRTQSLISGIGTTGAVGVDPATGIVDTVKSNPASALLILDLPVVAGDFKVTPQITTVLNRNYNSKLEKGDVEFLAGLSAGYKVNSAISVSLNGAYGSVSNENSLVGAYGSSSRSGTIDEIAALSTARDTLTYVFPNKTDTATTINKNVKMSYANKYISNGLIAGIGTTIKAGPGVIAFNVNYGNSYNGAEKYTDTTKTTTTTRLITNAKELIDPDDPDAGYKNVRKDTTFKFSETIKEEEFDPKTLTNKNDIVFDLRYTWNIHPKFSIMPRWRTYITTYDEGSKHVKTKIENRPELFLTGSF